MNFVKFNHNFHISGECYNITLTTFKPSGRYTCHPKKNVISHQPPLLDMWIICDLFILKDEENNQNSY